MTMRPSSNFREVTKAAGLAALGFGHCKRLRAICSRESSSYIENRHSICEDVAPTVGVPRTDLEPNPITDHES